MYTFIMYELAMRETMYYFMQELVIYVLVIPLYFLHKIIHRLYHNLYMYDVLVMKFFKLSIKWYINFIY